MVRHRCRHYQDLLPAELPGPVTPGPQRGVLPDRGGGPARRVPGLQAVPPRRIARLSGVGRPPGRGCPGDAAHRGWHRESGGCLWPGVPGCEEVRGGAYRRTLRLPNGNGIVALTPRADHVACRLVLDDLRDIPTAIARCRRLLDLDADPEAIADALSADPALAPLVTMAPGRRIPRTVDGAEMAVRVVLGQQVSTKAARTHAARLAECHGTPIDDPAGGLSRVFPSSEALRELDSDSLAMPKARRATVLALVGALAGGLIELDAGADRERARHQLAGLGGIGPWTLEMISMRVLGDPDAFPATDMGVVKGAAALGLPTTLATLTARSRRWQPWRSYAVQYLWATLDHPINHWTAEEPPWV